MPAKYLTALGILFVSFCLQAQSSYFNVSETEPFKDSRRGSSLEGVFTLIDGNVVAERAAKKDLLIRAFDYNKFILANLSKNKKQFLVLSKK